MAMTVINSLLILLVLLTFFTDCIENRFIRPSSPSCLGLDGIFFIDRKRCFCADTTRNCVNRTSAQTQNFSAKSLSKMSLKIDPMKMRQFLTRISICDSMKFHLNHVINHNPLIQDERRQRQRRRQHHG
jgi:hypothetical protein